MLKKLIENMENQMSITELVFPPSGIDRSHGLFRSISALIGLKFCIDNLADFFICQVQHTGNYNYFIAESQRISLSLSLVSESLSKEAHLKPALIYYMQNAAQAQKENIL